MRFFQLGGQQNNNINQNTIFIISLRYFRQITIYTI